MRTAGRVSLLLIAGIACVLLVVVPFFLAGDSPTSAASRFMILLAKGDAEGLTDMSYLGGTPREEMLKQWDFTVHDAAPYYRFTWNIHRTDLPNANSANVAIGVQRNAGTSGEYEENFGLPMIKVDGKWKVDVRGINREMYPDLPR